MPMSLRRTLAVAIGVLMAGPLLASAAARGSRPFAGVTDEQWRQRWRWMTPAVGGRAELLAPAPASVPFTPAEVNASKTGSVDWRSVAGKFLTTRVKNQAACGACAIFSILGVTEFHLARATTLTSLSVQSVLDCIHGPGLDGCQGANVIALGDALTTNGVALEMDYEYTSFDNRTYTCRNVQRRVYIKGLEQPDRKSASNYEDAMAAYVRLRGPLQISIDASDPDFMRYTGGIITSAVRGDVPLTHGVIIMGYGEDSGTAYWLVKNSWGPQWGESGYFRVARGSDLLGLSDSPLGVTLADTVKS